MITKLFPLPYYLYILQLQEYSWLRFGRWYLANWAKREFNQRKKLVWTPKAILIFVSTLVLMIGLGVGLTFSLKWSSLLLMVIVLSVLQLSGLFLLLALILIKPLEVLAKFYLVERTRRKIASMPNLKLVGITGSAGKTSTKEFLATILAQRFKVVKTPQSYNTPLGLAKTISEMPSDTQVFIAEMGAYRQGDIKKLARIAKPQIGILTFINDQHLATFGSLTNIIKGKYELIESLPKSGTAIFNNDNRYCAGLARKTRGLRVIRYSTDDKKVEVFASEIKLASEDTTFSLNFQGKKSIKVSTSLLGRHNVSNLLAASAAAMVMGLSPQEIKKGITSIIPPLHRLQVVSRNHSITVIDDSYNANPDGVMAALKVLRLFDNQRKILVTSGMVELGKNEKWHHLKLGRAAAKVADWVILVGQKRGEWIREGLEKSSFPQSRAVVVNDLAEAQEYLAKILIPPCVVLFQNDLPDSYR